MVEEFFSDFLKNRGYDESKIDNDRASQLRSMWKLARDEVETTGKDAAGHDVKVGDTVTITLRVTGVHAIPDDLERGLVNRTYVNLARLDGGVELHQFSLVTSLVTKV